MEQLQKIVFDMKKEIESLKEKIKSLEQKQRKQEEIKEDSPKRKRVKKKWDTYLDNDRMNVTEDSTAWEESDTTVQIPRKEEKYLEEYRHPVVSRSPQRSSLPAFI